MSVYIGPSAEVFGWARVFGSLIGLIVWVFVGALVAQARDATVSGCITDTGQLVGTQVANRGYVGGDITAVDTGEVIGRLNLKNTKGQPARSFSTPVSRVTPAEATWGHRAGENEWGYAYFPLCTPPTTTTIQETTTTWPETTTTTVPSTSAPSTTVSPSTTVTSTTSSTTSVPETTAPSTTTTVPSTTMPTSTTSTSPPTTSSATTTTAPSSSTSEAPTTTGPSGSSSTTSTPSTSAPSTTTTASTSSTPSTTDAPAERSTSELPRTGLSVLVLVIVGLGLVALGAVLWLGVKRDEWSQR